MPAAHRPVRVALVDDYEIVIAGVREMLEPYADRVAVVSWASRAVPPGDPDVILCDMFAYIEGEEEGVSLATLAEGSARLVAYSWSTDERAVTRARQQGAVACVSKGLTATELVSAIEVVAAGKDLPDPPPGSPRRSAFARHTAATLAGLSPREAEVLALIAKGLSNDEIAAEMYLSVNSVKTYVRTGYRKIGVSRRSQAVGWAIRHGLLPATGRGMFDPER